MKSTEGGKEECNHPFGHFALPFRVSLSPAAAAYQPKARINSEAYDTERAWHRLFCRKMV
jgi:hypothetical protein